MTERQLTNRHQKLADMVSSPDYAGLTPEEVFAALTTPVPHYGAVPNFRVVAQMAGMPGQTPGKRVWHDIEQAVDDIDVAPGIDLQKGEIARELLLQRDMAVNPNAYIDMGGEKFAQLSAAALAYGMMTPEQVEIVKNVDVGETTLADQAGLHRLSVDEVMLVMGVLPDEGDDDV